MRIWSHYKHNTGNNGKLSNRFIEWELQQRKKKLLRFSTFTNLLMDAVVLVRHHHSVEFKKVVFSDRWWEHRMQTLQITPSFVFPCRQPVSRGSGAWPEGSPEWDRPLHPTGVCQWEPWLGQHPHTRNSRGLLQSVGRWLFQLLGEESLYVHTNCNFFFIYFALIVFFDIHERHKPRCTVLLVSNAWLSLIQSSFCVFFFRGFNCTAVLWN